MKRKRLKAIRTFLNQGTCSRTLFYILNREYGYPREEEEQAIDLLAGGIMQEGDQCGMLWGASMGAGAESYRRYKDKGLASAHAMVASQHLLESFVKHNKSANCRDIARTDFKKRSSMIKFMFFKAHTCFRMAAKWAPKALQTAEKGLKDTKEKLPTEPISCASEVVKKMGGTDEQMVMVAGFAGGIGFSGHACGAYGAAIWMNTLKWNKENAYKKGNTKTNPLTTNTQIAFYDAVNFDVNCSDICGQRFKTVAEHTEYIKNGGCSKLIDLLASA